MPIRCDQFLDDESGDGCGCNAVDAEIGCGGCRCGRPSGFAIAVRASGALTVAADLDAGAGTLTLEAGAGSWDSATQALNIIGFTGTSDIGGQARSR